MALARVLKVLFAMDVFPIGIDTISPNINFNTSWGRISMDDEAGKESSSIIPSSLALIGNILSSNNGVVSNSGFLSLIWGGQIKEKPGSGGRVNESFLDLVCSIRTNK